MRLRDADMFSDDVFKFAIAVSNRACNAPKLARCPLTAASAESITLSAWVEPLTVETSMVFTETKIEAAEVGTRVAGVPDTEKPLSELNSKVPIVTVEAPAAAEKPGAVSNVNAPEDKDASAFCAASATAPLLLAALAISIFAPASFVRMIAVPSVLSFAVMPV